VEYEILKADTVYELTQEGRRYISLGWKPQGGVTVALTYEDGGFSPFRECCQAMVKEIESPPPPATL